MGMAPAILSLSHTPPPFPAHKPVPPAHSLVPPEVLDERPHFGVGGRRWPEPSGHHTTHGVLHDLEAVIQAGRGVGARCRCGGRGGGGVRRRFREGWRRRSGRGRGGGGGARIGGREGRGGEHPGVRRCCLGRGGLRHGGVRGGGAILCCWCGCCGCGCCCWCCCSCTAPWFLRRGLHLGSCREGRAIDVESERKSERRFV